MSKKKIKNMKLEQDELKPLTIGVFESRKKSSIGVIFIMAIFILAIVFLPEISNIIDEYLHPNIPIVPPDNPSNPNKPNPDDGEDGEDEVFYQYTSELKIIHSDVIVSNLVVDNVNNTISYTVTNNKDNYQNIEELNYFLEIYNSEKTLIERVKLANEANLASDAFKSYTRVISSDAATNIGFLVLVKKKTTDYPAFEIGIKEDGTSTLVCTNIHEKVTYKFKNYQLNSLISEASYKNTDLDYAEKYEANKILSNTYNSKNGIISTFFEYDTGYNITTSVDLKEATREYIFNADSFKLNTEPKVVKFEAETQGFKCSEE